METSVKIIKNETGKKDREILSILAEKFSGMKAPETSSKSSKLIYLFERQNLSKIECKKLRTKNRNKLDKFAFDLHCAGTKGNLLEIKKIVSEFLKFYKETYILNDFSFASVRSAMNNETDKKRIEILLQTAKEMQG